MKKVLLGLSTLSVIGAIVLALPTSTAHSQQTEAPMLEMARLFGQERICDVSPILFKQMRHQPLTLADKKQLYLRCEILGGSDEFTSNSCCDHFGAGEGSSLNVCPDNPPELMVPARDMLRNAMSCKRFK